MTIKPLKVGAFAFLFAFAFAANAVQQTLPTPPPSAYPDTESEADVAVTNGPSLGRRVKLTLSADFTPSNGVQVAFGQDENADGDLEPAETRVVFGVDCGVPFVREEFRRGRGQSLAAQFGLADNPLGGQGLTAAPGASTFTFAFRQPSAVTNRLTHAKVTTRGRGNSAAQIAAEITRPGAALILQ